MDVVEKPGYLTYKNERLSYVEIKPENPENIRGAVVFNPGFGGALDNDTHDNNTNAPLYSLAEKGFYALGFNLPGVDTSSGIFSVQNSIDSLEWVIHDYLREEKRFGDNVFPLGHSLSGYTVVKALANLEKYAPLKGFAILNPLMGSVAEELKKMYPLVGPLIPLYENLIRKSPLKNSISQAFIDVLIHVGFDDFLGKKKFIGNKYIEGVRIHDPGELLDDLLYVTPLTDVQVQAQGVIFKSKDDELIILQPDERSQYEFNWATISPNSEVVWMDNSGGHNLQADMNIDVIFNTEAYQSFIRQTAEHFHKLAN